MSSTFDVNAVPPPAPVSGTDSDHDGIQFLQFAKNYIGLLATVASLPLLSSVIGILPPPRNDSKLALLSSFICVIVFGLCFMLKGLIARLAVSGKMRTRIALFLLGFTILSVAVYAASLYIGLVPVEAGAGRVVESYRQLGAGGRVSVQQAALLYFGVFGLMVLALGLVLITSYTQTVGRQLESLIDSRLAGTTAEPRLRDVVSNYAAFYTHASQGAAIREIGDVLLCEYEDQLKLLSHAEVMSVGTSTARLQALLLTKLSRSFVAVSDRDLGFWAGADVTPDTVADRELAEEYFRLNIQAVRNGTSITRIFLLRDNDIVDHEDDLARVLAQQHNADIAWAVIPFRELDPSLQSETLPLDFGLFDDGAAVSFFRDYRETARKFSAVFRTPENEKRIQEQQGVFRRLLGQCWMANQKFIDRYQGEPEMRLVRKTREMVARRIGVPLEGDQAFLIEVREAAEIRAAVAVLRDFRQRSRESFNGHASKVPVPKIAEPPAPSLV